LRFLFDIIFFLYRIKYVAAYVTRFAIEHSTTGAILIATG